ncbi:MAG: hypothetical protein ACK424_09020, partial [Candidatus Thermochlorobacter sp.]
MRKAAVKPSQKAEKIQVYDLVGLPVMVVQDGLKIMQPIYDYHSTAHSRAIIQHANILPDEDVVFLSDAATAHRTKRILEKHAKRRFAIVVIAT